MKTWACKICGIDEGDHHNARHAFLRKKDEFEPATDADIARQSKEFGRYPAAASWPGLAVECLIARIEVEKAQCAKCATADNTFGEMWGRYSQANQRIAELEAQVAACADERSVVVLELNIKIEKLEAQVAAVRKHNDELTKLVQEGAG